MNQIVSLLSIRRGEGRMATLVMGIMLFTSAGSSFGSVVIEALFFARFGTQYLPYMYMGLGLTAILVSFGITAILGRISRELLYIALPIALTLILVASRIALLSHHNWLYPALWLGKEIVNSLIGLLVWGIAGIVCDTRQAKRLYPLFNACRILGAVIGGLITGLLVARLGSENLMLAWAVTLMLTFFLGRALLQTNRSPLPHPPIARQKTDSFAAVIQRGYQYVRASSLLRWISIASILFSVLYFSIALPFSRAVTDHYVNEDALASFLGLFNGLSTAVAFLISLFLANRLMMRFGIMACLLAFTSIYFLGFGILSLYGVFTLILAFRFFQLIWLSGVADPAYQAVFNVIPSERREQVRTFVSGVPEQAGTFIAGFILLVGDRALSSNQLYWIGAAAAALCFYAMWQARRGYSLALVNALRAGIPHIFFNEDQPFSGFHQDALAVQTAILGMQDPNPAVRRVAADILGHIATHEAERALLDGLHDEDSFVRTACIRGLRGALAESAQSKIAACLRDADPEVRMEAVTAIALATESNHLVDFLAAMLVDSDPRVGIRAAAGLLRAPSDENIQLRASEFLREKVRYGSINERIEALTVFGEFSDAETFEFLKTQAEDDSIPSAARRAAIPALARANEAEAIPVLAFLLGDSDRGVREAAADALGKIGQPALAAVIVALKDSRLESGALRALEKLNVQTVAPSIYQFAVESRDRALYAAQMKRSFAGEEQPAKILLADSLKEHAQTHGLRALRALSLLGEREALLLSIETLQSTDSNQRANAFETLDSLGSYGRGIIRPLIQVWDESVDGTISPIDSANVAAHLEALLTHHDDWIRACAAYAAQNESTLSTQLDRLAESDPDPFVRDTARARGGTMDTLATLSIMDRIFFLRRVPIFAGLAPADLKQVAVIAEEVLFTDGDVLAYQGESGDTMFVIVSGEIEVIGGKDQVNVVLAQRKPGEYVGEMSIISHEPRMATLKALGEVRVLCIDRKSFEGLLRERPDAGLAVMQVLCMRLKEAGQKLESFIHQD